MSEEQERERLRRKDPIGEVRRETLAVYGVLGPGHSEEVYLRFLERGVWRRQPSAGVGDPQAGPRTGLARRLARFLGLESDSYE